MSQTYTIACLHNASKCPSTGALLHFTMTFLSLVTLWFPVLCKSGVWCFQVFIFLLMDMSCKQKEMKHVYVQWWYFLYGLRLLKYQSLLLS